MEPRESPVAERSAFRPHNPERRRWWESVYAGRLAGARMAFRGLAFKTLRDSSGRSRAWRSDEPFCGQHL